MEIVRWESVPAEKIHDGVERQVIWGEKATLARFALARGTHISKHSHAAEQFTCVIRGVMRMTLAGRELVLRVGDVLVVPPHIEHEVWIVEDCVVIDYFSPPRDDWKEGRSQYLAGR